MAKEEKSAPVESMTTETSKAKAEPVKGSIAKRMVYVGPARPYGLPLMNRAVLMAGAAVAGLEKAKKDHPALGRLFVPIEKLAQARAALLQSGDPLRVAYETVQKETLAQRKDGGK